ncbi:MAG: N-acetylmuramoyl-L-alanine amidase [Clostridiales bacterium]|nr:N-acetylmuramoyl-L-alanine amidase [Clostridiales bacterium]
MRKLHQRIKTDPVRPETPRSRSRSSDKKQSGSLIPLMLVCLAALSVGGILTAHFLGLFSDSSPMPTTVSTPVLIGSSDSAAASAPAENLPLTGKTIFLDAGHGGYDNGCIYPDSDPTYVEKDFNLQIAFETQEELEALGAKVIMLRTDDSFLSIYARPAMVHLFCLDHAEELGMEPLPEDLELRLREGMEEAIRVNSEDISAGCMGAMVGSGFSEDMIALMESEYKIDDVIFLSIHNNWNSDPSLHGTQMYFVTDDSIIKSEERLIREDPYYSDPDYIVREGYWGREWERNRLLSRFLHDAITESAPELEPNVPELVEDNFAVLREHGLASVMLELTFVSNPEDRDRLTNEQVIRKMAKGIAQGCIYYYNNTNS